MGLGLVELDDRARILGLDTGRKGCLWEFEEVWEAHWYGWRHQLASKVHSKNMAWAGKGAVILALSILHSSILSHNKSFIPPETLTTA
jgi:hypothetical protein